MKHLLVARAVALAVLAPWGFAQQFQHQTGMIPGTPRWTEGVECADIDLDGDLDLFFADGEGFSSAGLKRQNIVLRNQWIESGVLSFVDESVARLGVHTSHAKGVTTADVNGDGWIDVLFVNAFNTDPPLLYINRGAAQPGYFDMESATRGLTQNLSSAGAQFGDLDDDGDLDLIACDSGSSFLSSPGGKPRLYFNDGSGHFSEDAAALAAPTKMAHMDVQLIDIDGDWDLDFFGPNRATNTGGNHYLLLNDGAGQFSNSSALIPAASGNTYEAEVGDFDNDTDIDLFFVSLSGFQEGHVRSDAVPSGTLGFTAGALQSGNVDDNEIALIDYDVDGDLNVAVGSLDSTERFYKNQGALSFVADTIVTAVSDSTLDLAVGDLDNDGRYDIVTAQGESGIPQWANKVYLNTGAVDTLPPVITAVDVPAAPSIWPVIVHGKMRDQVIDDGVTYVTARAAYAPVDASLQTVNHQGGAFAPAVLNVAAGSRVQFTNQDATAESATSTTPPYGYDLALSAGGGMAGYVFVSPGTYNYTSSGSGATGQIIVTGTASQVDGHLSGGGLYRFALAEIPATASNELAVELFFRDWADNESVSESYVISYPPPNATSYCTGKTNSLGCIPFISTSGAPSTSSTIPFNIVGNDHVPAEFGILIYGFAKGNLSFHGGKLCVKAPFTRLSAKAPKAASNCFAGAGSMLTRNFNATIQGGSDPALTAGAAVFAQWRQRDPSDLSGFGDNLTNGVSFVVNP